MPCFLFLIVFVHCREQAKDAETPPPSSLCLSDKMFLCSCLENKPLWVFQLLVLFFFPFIVV